MNNQVIGRWNEFMTHNIDVIITLIGGLFVTVLSFIMILTVYGRFFKLYLLKDTAKRG